MLQDTPQKLVTKKKKFLGSKMRLVLGADNRTAIYEPIV
jgi:hypothetical protein